MERSVPYYLRHTLYEPDMAPTPETETTLENNENFTQQSRRKTTRACTQSQTTPEIEVTNQFAALATIEEEQTEPCPPPLKYVPSKHTYKRSMATC